MIGQTFLCKRRNVDYTKLSASVSIPGKNPPDGRGTRCWPSCWYDCQFVRHPICASGGAGVVHILINPAHPKSSEQAEGYHHLSPHFSFPRSKVKICVLSSPRRLEGIPETGFTLFGSGIGRAQIAHCMSFRSVLLKQP